MSSCAPAKDLSPAANLAVVTAALLGYLLLRTFLNWQLEMHNYSSRTFTAANRSFYTYAIGLFFLLFFSGALVRAFGGSDGLARSVLLWEAAVTYFFYIIRRGQIFASACNPFTTFLYLCSLELLPTAVLVLSGRLL